MAFRGTESPMEFEWQGTGHGPVDMTSPFHRHAVEANKKRTHTQFESPQKPSFPALREPNNQPFFFAQPPTPATPTSPFRAPSFTTPRKPFDIDFSSPPDNSSPAEQADNEDTPDHKPLPIEFTGTATQSPGKRNSLFNIYGRFAPSPGRGEIRKPPSDAIAKRIHKRRRRAQQFDKQIVVRRQSEEETDDDEQQEPQPQWKEHGNKMQEVGWMAGLFTFIHTYPDAPSIIAKYLQVFFNAAILGGCLYMFYSFYATIRADVDRASEEAMAEVLAEMAACANHYVENQCGADRRAPALEALCQNWELCMNRDASAVKRAKLSAHTFAEIFNSFVEPISLKTMIFTITLVIVGLLINNATFTLYRRQQDHHHENFRPASGTYGHSVHPSMYMNQFPATPGIGHGQTQSVGWHDARGLGKPLSIDYSQSPSKEYRARSRSPEKRLLSR